MDGKRVPRVALLPALYMLVAALAVLGIDWSIRSAANAISRYQLQAAANREIEYVLAETERLAGRMQQLTEELQQSRNRHLPTIDDIKTLASDHSLRIDRVERLRAQSENELFPRYRMTFHGTVSGLTGLLHDLEQNFVCGIDRIDLWPYSTDGSVVAMSLSATTEEQ